MVNNISRNQRLIRFIIKKQIINRITSCQYPLNKYPKLSQPPLAFRNMAKKENIVIKVIIVKYFFNIYFTFKIFSILYEGYPKY